MFPIHRLVPTLLAFCILPFLLHAQENSTKSKSTQKEKDDYEKPFSGGLAGDARIYNVETINTPNLDFSPTFYQNGIVYVTSRQKNGSIDKQIGETFFELYYAELNLEGIPMKPQEFSINVNSKTHEGPLTFNRNGTVMYFTRNNTTTSGVRQADSKGVTRLKIYEARKGEFDWESIVELPFNNNEYSTCHPTLSVDGRRLYFSSDMPGGYGGFDLYFVEKRGDTWSQPINLGKEINTPENEVFPFIHETGVLFFASDGRTNSYGGLDIFMVNLTSNDWSSVVNIGLPFNSPQDDLGFILDPDSRFGFFTSNRSKGLGGDDIYRFELPSGMVGVDIRLLPTRIIAFDKSNNERIPQADVRVFERTPDGLIKNDDFYDIVLQPAEDGSGEVIMKMVRKPTAQMGEPFAQTNDNGEAVVQIKSDRNYLVLVSKEGYTTSEVIYSTVGETLPQTIRAGLNVRNCNLLYGMVTVDNYDTRVPHAEVRVVNNCNQIEQVVRTNSDGRFEICLPKGCNFTLYAQKEGFSKGVDRVSTVNLTGDLAEINLRINPMAENILKEPIREGTVIVLENLYYDFNKSAIRTGEARELEALAAMMNLYPSMEIELSAHTDSRGSADYNLELSQDRAEAAKEFLVSRGVNAARIRAAGYGESKLRNNCADDVDCTEEEHQYNRRTEVRVTRISEGLNIQYKKEAGG